MEFSEYFTFLEEYGVTFERDYSKGTDTTCTQIYRIRKDGANYLEFRAMNARERGLVVCANGEKKFPSVQKKYASFLRGWKLKHLFQEKDEWQLAADLTRHVLEETGTLFGIALSGDLSKKQTDNRTTS